MEPEHSQAPQSLAHGSRPQFLKLFNRSGRESCVMIIYVDIRRNTPSRRALDALDKSALSPRQADHGDKAR
jgi:hypothetical protein